MRGSQGTAAFVVSALLMAAPAHAQQPLSFRDDFTGERLAPEFRVLNPDPDRMAMVDGEYVLLVTHKDIKNAFAYVNEMAEDYELIVRFASVPGYDFQGAGIVLGEGEHSLEAALFLPSGFRCCNNRPYFYFDKQLRDERSKYKVEIETDQLKSFSLKITKHGVEYDAEYSFDEMSWSLIGTHASIRPYDRPAFRAFVSGGEAPESPMRVDSFEVIDITSH